MMDRKDIESQNPGPLIDPAGGPEDEALLGIYDPDAEDEDDEEARDDDD